MTTDDPTLARQRLLELRARQRQAAADVDAPRAAARPAALPVNCMQEGLWFVEQLHPGAGLFHSAFATRLAGPLDRARLERSLQALVDRHEALRTRFRDAADAGLAVVQEVAPAGSVPLRLEVHPLADAAELPQWLDAVTAASFDLAAGPPLRARLARLGPFEHVLLIVVHHLVFDGWSQGVLWRELGQIYDAGGSADTLPALPLQAADHALWQRHRLRQPALKAQLDHWRARLDGLVALDLPADRARPAEPSHRGALHRFEIDAGLVAALQSRARRQDATLFMVLMAAFQVLLMRLTRQDDVAVAVPVAGRTHAVLEGLIGCFVNTVVLRSDLSGDPPFTEALARVRAGTLDALAHQELPFDRLVAELAPQRDLSRNPLVQVSFQLDNQPRAAPRLEGLDTEPVALSRVVAQYDLSMRLHARDGALHGTIDYASELFDARRIARLALRYARLLQAIAADASTSIGRLPWMDDAERAALLDAGGRGRPAPHAPGVLHRLIASQARRRPQAPALVGDDGGLSHAELEAAANRLAHRLHALGVGPGVAVAVSLPRSAALVVAALAVLRAGGVYVPLDPAEPAARRAYMLADCAARVLVTTPGAAEVETAARVLCPDAEADEIAALPACGPDDRSSPDDPAYVIYTSGSTGRPKGVVVPHRALAAHARWFVDTVALGPADRILAKTSIGFDASLVELLEPLAAGAALVLAAPEGDRDPAGIVRAIRAHEVTVLQMVPSALRVLIAQPELVLCRSLRVLVSGGETLDRALARDLRRMLPQLALYNLYGPTEAGIDATAHAVTEVAAGRGSVPIGQAVAHGRAHVLDAALQPVPAGVAGELYLGGEGLALGYLGAPDLTAERFVPDPFEPGRRLYRSGDLACRREADSLLEFVGRTDRQVKLRGLRIEPGEIEAALVDCAGVREAAVLLREDTPGSPRLVAYVAGASLQEATLRDALRHRIGEAWLPSAFVVLAGLPRLPSGKLDRQALPAPGERVVPAAVAPRTQVEQALAAIWADVLGLAGVGVFDNFFDLGGHSLLATQVVARARATFQVELPLKALFESPTVAGLAERLQQLAPDAATAPIRARPPGRLVCPPSSVQESLWFIEQIEGAGGVYNTACALRLSGVLDTSRLLRCFQALVTRHESLRTGFEATVDDGLPVVQRILPADAVPPLKFETASLADDTALSAWLAAGAARPFDLAQPPLMRVQLACRADDERVLLLVVHHIVFDGWSLGVLLRELGALYAADADLAVLPPLALQPADHALWQREHEDDLPMLRQLEHWRARLQDLPVLDLSSATARPARASHRGAVQRFVLDPQLTETLRGLGRREDATLFMVLLAAFQVLLMRLSHQRDLAVGVPIAGRPRAELENLVGCFVNVLVLRADLSGAPAFTEVLRQVRERALDAYAHQDLPFERLVAELAPQRDLSRNPLVQVSFQLDSQRLAAPDLPGLQVHALDVPHTRAKFDLSMALTEAEHGLRGEIEYATDLFDAPAMQALAGQFATLLRGIAADASQAIHRLPLMDAVERSRLLALAGPLRGAETTGLLERIARQGAQRGDAPAVIDATGVLGHAELDARANRLAHHLHALGVGPGRFVGVCLSRSMHLPVAVLAVLRCGAVYVPLDPAEPAARRAFMLADCDATLLLTERSLRTAEAGPATLCLDAPEIAAAIDHRPATPPGRWPSREDPAYVIYTSGSTGRPKGVVVPHRALAAHARWFVDTVALGPADRILAKTSIGFDASLVELLEPLAAGAALVLVPAEVAHDQAALVQAMQAHGVTLVQSVPSALRALLAEPGLAACTTLRRLVCGGEALDRALARELRRRLPQVALGNFYGPTEAGIDATWHEVDEAPPGAGTVPIGRLVDHAIGHVLDEWLQPVPAGVVGELYIGGEGLARAYLNDPALTAERFIDDPFRPGGRLYRSGDLVRRRLGDGLLEFVGRADGQVKLRGLRIELGEIEAALAECDGVREAAVLLREDRPGQPRLVAYVVGDEPGLQPGRPQQHALREALRRRLPEAWLPSCYVALPALPRLASDKLDRHSLPAPDGDATAAHVAPRSPIEQTLADIWAEVLGLSSVGVHDNFFDIGGHSLMATQVVSRTRLSFRVELPLQALFEAPTVAELAEHIVRRLAPDGAASLPERRPILPRPRDRRLPVSFSQRRMWLLQQMDPQGVAYNMPLALRLVGALDLEALRAAVDTVVRRHEAFRTVFVLAGDEPEAQIGPPAPARIDHHLMRQPDAAAREAAAARLIGEASNEPFDLARGPLHRWTLVRVHDDTHLLGLVMHHVVCDDWSFGVLLRELSEAYAAHRAKRPPGFAGRTVEFADYAAWQREQFGPETLHAQWLYWQRRLDGLQPLGLLPDHGVPGPRSSRGANVVRPFPPALIDRVRRLSRELAASPFMTLLAAFVWQLSRHAAQDDVAVGTPIANRTSLESEQLVGTLVNTLVLRTDAGGDPSFAELVARVRDAALGAYAHQDLPFDYLVERLRQHPAGAPFGDLKVLFNVLNTPWDAVRFDGLAARLEPNDRTAAQFDLALHVDLDISREIGVTVATDLYTIDTANRLLDRYLDLLGQALDDPGLPMSRLRLAGASELAQIARWNATDTDDDRGPRALVHELLREQAQRSADAPALVCGGRTLSHAALDAASNRLARLLRARGIGRGALVGLCVERGIDMVVAQLAVLKSGAGYVPLDPDFPAARLAFMARDAGLALLVSQTAAADRIDWPPQRCLPLDTLAAALADLPDTRLAADDALDARPQDPAYVIYTSGSTGQPKGVAVPHAAVVNFLRSMAREPGLAAHDRLLAVTTLSFDIAVLELLLPLAVGAQVVIAGRDEAVDGATLLRLIGQHGITLLQATPSTWRLLLEAGWRATPGLRALVGGEGLPPDLARQMLERCDEVWNMYGPTETTVWSSCARVASQERGITIGRPIANTQIHVLDAEGQPCPIGVPGEICIGGAGVALGYLHRPELSAERFVDDPARPGRRRYRTGDRGRWRHDGQLEHLGRLDHQVKVRGYRIELGEIEATLGAHPDVAQSLVVVREDRPGDARLVAYVVGAGGARPSAGALREHLRSRLPEYMLPQHVVTLEAIPLLPNGKTDRSRLPEPGTHEDDLAAPVAPRTPREQAVAEIWQRLLSLPQVGVQDNFFDLGGHSLLAARAALEISQALGEPVAMRRLIFESLAQIAAEAEPVDPPPPPRGGWFARLLGRPRR